MFFQEYEKLGFIGKGAFASVYKVRHADLGYVRALKVCNQFIEDENDKAWQTFLSECRLLLRIGNGSHPNIVRIYPPRLLDNRAVVEMDCVEGDSLDRYVADNKVIPIEEFYRFAQQIVGAVAYCHVDVYRFQMDPVADNLSPNPADARKYLISPEKERELIAKYGVVHNDLHSNNIIRRDYDGQYILLDFGLAIQDRHCVKSSSRFDGAIEYCSPEKLDRGEVTPQSDVYSLGILMYEVLAGRVPFKCDSSGDGFVSASATNRVYMQHLKEMPPSIFELRKQAFESTHPGETYTADYPQELENIILKCLAKNPADRYANAKELLMDLRKVEKLQPRVADTAMGAGAYSVTENAVSASKRDKYKQAEIIFRQETGGLAALKTDRAGLSQTAGIPAPAKHKPSGKGKYLWIAIAILFVGAVMILPQLSRDNRISDPYDEEDNVEDKEMTIDASDDLNMEKAAVENTVMTINGHEYVDLGLPSGLKWATCNVGASSPEDYGNYYAWGETGTKTSYSESNSSTYGKTLAELRNAGIIDGSYRLTLSHDAACANWGGTWRMPTKAECEELRDKCTWTRTTQNSVNGDKVTGPNGRSIFLPAAGYRIGTSLKFAGKNGYFWSSSAYDGSIYAYILFFSSGGRDVDWFGRDNGRSVRPVSE